MQLWLKTKELPTGKKSHRGAGKCGQWGKREMGNGERNTVDVKGEAHTSQVRKLLFALFLLAIVVATGFSFRVAVAVAVIAAEKEVRPCRGSCAESSILITYAIYLLPSPGNIVQLCCSCSLRMWRKGWPGKGGVAGQWRFNVRLWSYFSFSQVSPVRKCRAVTKCSMSGIQLIGLRGSSERFFERK